MFFLKLRTSVMMQVYGALGMRQKRMIRLIQTTDIILESVGLQYGSQTYWYAVPKAVNDLRTRYAESLAGFARGVDDCVSQSGVENPDQIAEMMHNQLYHLDEVAEAHALVTWLAKKWRRSIAASQPRLDSGYNVLSAYLPESIAKAKLA